jgi:S1-C subfamily serine protease
MGEFLLVLVASKFRPQVPEKDCDFMATDTSFVYHAPRPIGSGRTSNNEITKMTFHRLCLAVLPIALPSSLTAAEDTLPRTELAKRGKPATALVLVEPGRVSGTAFVVHSDGLLVTNEHVVAPAARTGGRIRVALSTAQAEQRVLDAAVVRSDKERDLAVLRVVGHKGLTTLEWGDSDKLTELTELIGFGYPFGTALSSNSRELPAVTVSVSSVTSLRRKGKELISIQLDGALNPGHSGGPLLAADGKVVGVIRSGIPGAQIAQAIPATVVKEFLAAPEITISDPTLQASKLDQAVEFSANVVTLLNGGPPTKVEMILESGNAPARQFSMSLRDGVYRASAIPLLNSGSKMVGVSARFGTTTISGSVPDREFAVGQKKLKLSQVQRIESSDSPKTTLLNGESVSGSIVGLGSVELRLADQPLRVDLAKADRVEFVPPAEPSTLIYSVVASVDGKEVARKSLNITLPKTGGAQPESKIVLSPVDLEASRVTRALPDRFSDVCMGGGGRYLFFLLPKLAKIALFDVAQAKIVNYFPAPDPNVKFAAGIDKLIIALPTHSILQRWNLTTFERELSVPFVGQQSIHMVLLGHASNGPVVVNGNYLNLSSLSEMDLKDVPRGGPRERFGFGTQAAISADGTVVGRTATNSSPGGLDTIILTENALKLHHLHTSPGYVQPSPNGKLIFTSNIVYSSDLKPLVHLQSRQQVHYLPAAHGNMFIALRDLSKDAPNDGPVEKKIEFTLYLGGNTRPLAQIGRFSDEILGLATLGSGELNKRVWLIPDAKLLVTLPPSQDSVNLIRFDLDEVLENTGYDYLFVTSELPTDATKGGLFTHQMIVKSKKGGVKCKLDSGPAGMSVTEAGWIEWRVPANFTGDSTAVIVSVTDASGQEVYQTVTLRVRN